MILTRATLSEAGKEGREKERTLKQADIIIWYTSQQQQSLIQKWTKNIETYEWKEQKIMANVIANEQI